MLKLKFMIEFIKCLLDKSDGMWYNRYRKWGWYLNDKVHKKWNYNRKDSKGNVYYSQEILQNSTDWKKTGIYGQCHQKMELNS